MGKSSGDMRHNTPNQFINEELKWFLSEREVFKLEYIENKLGMPKTTLNHWVNGYRELPAKWVGPLTEWVKKLRHII